jgi:hypothetical protein
LRRLLPYLRLLSLTPLETTKLPPNFLTTDEKLAVLEANVKKPLTRAALNKIPKPLSTETNPRCVVVHKQQLITAFKCPSIRSNLKRINSREVRSIGNTLRVVPKVNLNLVQVCFLGCHSKAIQSLNEKMLYKVSVTTSGKVNTRKVQMLLFKGERGYLKLEKPIFLPKNKETDITLIISVVGTAYFLNYKDSSIIDDTSYFKKITLARDPFVDFFQSFDFVTA